MKVIIAEALGLRMIRDLQQAGNREIGGVLFAEQLSEGEFLILEATRQRFGGNATTFRRRVIKARKEVRALHKSYGGIPERYNYLGEWHSHPAAAVHPSARDADTMWRLLEDADGTVNFLVLLIARLRDQTNLELSATAYLASGHSLNCDLELQSERM